MEPLLKIQEVSKRFGAVQALTAVDMNVFAGDVHALIGENGAGKSTLMKVLSGAHKPDGGAITYEGRPYTVPGPSAARNAGIAMIYQELTLAPHLSVEANIMLGIEVSRGGWVQHQRHRVREVLDWMGHPDINPDMPVGHLPISLQQVVEISRALVANARVVIMDEPTSSLTEADTASLFNVVRRLRDRGMAVIYISHFLEEIMAVCDRYTVLRDGASVGCGMVADATVSGLIEAMIGRSVEDMYPRHRHTLGAPVLSVQALRGRRLPKQADFILRRGEILGVAGLVGSGRSETARCLFGLDQAAAGRMTRDPGRTIRVRTLSPPGALHEGIDMLSENRKEEGLATAMSITANVTLSGLQRYTRGGLLDLACEHAQAQAWCRRMGVKCRDIDDPVASLSGGNQQKVALARLLHQDCDILLLDEPTRGIDVGSKAEIYRLIMELAEQGKALLIISSYLPELLGVCDSLVVMHRGTMSPKRAVGEWTEQSIMRYATSGKMEEINHV